jgi:hypothetical protein
VRSLFTKILLWFFLTVLVTSAASFYISTIFLRARQPNFNRMSFELREARKACSSSFFAIKRPQTTWSPFWRTHPDTTC